MPHRGRKVEAKRSALNRLSVAGAQPASNRADAAQPPFNRTPVSPARRDTRTAEEGEHMTEAEDIELKRIRAELDRLLEQRDNRVMWSVILCATCVGIATWSPWWAGAVYLAFLAFRYMQPPYQP